MKRYLFFLLITGLLYHLPANAQQQLRTLGTRSWIRLQWEDNSKDTQGYRLYWSLTPRKPVGAGVTLPSGSKRYYIDNVRLKTYYYIWLEGNGSPLTAKVYTDPQWVLEEDEVRSLPVASSAAVPAGMQLYWQDEFNDLLLNRNKWTTNYYSTIDFKSGTQLSAMQHDSLPQPAYEMTGSSIRLFVNDTLPSKAYWPSRKISSIQTYDWRTNERYLDNSRGGYYEVRVRRRNTRDAVEGLNLAYWLDSPGPDLRYYMEQGNSYAGVAGVRPRGQAFEIDVFEQNGDAATTVTTPFTLHGDVDASGNFQHNLATLDARLASQDGWHTHGLLWTAAGLQYFIDGVLTGSWTDSSRNMSPNHWMNVFLGTYYGWKAGMKGNAEMEVDYIRGYQWPVGRDNELPNPGFECGKLYPWEGTGIVSATGKRSGQAGLVLSAGAVITQYVYLDHSSPYQLALWFRGQGRLHVEVATLRSVTQAAEKVYEEDIVTTAQFRPARISFVTGKEPSDHLHTVRIRIRNTGKGTIMLDDLSLKK